MSIKTTRFDLQEHLQSDEACRLFLEAAFEDCADDSAYLAKAIGEVARARGMSQLARDAGLAHESLYRSLFEDGNPSFATINKVLHALGLRLTAVEATRARAGSG